MDELKAKIREIPDFPKPGILFYDVTTLLGDPEGLGMVIDRLADQFSGQGIEQVLGIESRGFIFGPAVAHRIGAGFVPVRKPGKLPYRTIQASYELEYGQDSIEMHVDAVQKGQRVLILDDLIATGGTAGATLRLARELGAEVMCAAFLIELEFLQGRKQLPDCEVYSMLKY